MTRHPSFAERERVYRQLIPPSFVARHVLDVGATAASVSFLREVLPAARVSACNVRAGDLLPLASDATVCRAEALPFPDDAFDLVFAGEVLEHVLYPNEFLDRVASVLRRGGLLLLSTPNLTAWHNRLLVAFGYSPSNYSMLPDRPVGLPAVLGRRLGHGYGDHVRVFGFRALREVFGSDPWELVAVRGQNCRAEGRAFRHVRRLADVLPSALREDVFVCARNTKRAPMALARSGGFVGSVHSVTPRWAQ